MPGGASGSRPPAPGRQPTSPASQPTTSLPRDLTGAGSVPAAAPPAPHRVRDAPRPILSVSASSGGVGATTIALLLRSELSRRLGVELPARHRGDDRGRLAAPTGLPEAGPTFPAIVDAGAHGADLTHVRDGGIVLVCAADRRSVDQALADVGETAGAADRVQAIVCVERRPRTATAFGRGAPPVAPGRARLIRVPFDRALVGTDPIEPSHLAPSTLEAIGHLVAAVAAPVAGRRA